jgi:hypothetical protein
MSALPAALQSLNIPWVKYGIPGVIVIAGAVVGVVFGLRSNATTTWIALGSVFALLALIMAILALMKMPSGINSGSSLGVLSFSARSAEVVTSLSVRFLPISLVWLGLLLSALTANANFIIPSAISIITVGFIAGCQSFLPNL